MSAFFCASCILIFWALCGVLPVLPSSIISLQADQPQKYYKGLNPKKYYKLVKLPVNFFTSFVIRFWCRQLQQPGGGLGSQGLSCGWSQLFLCAPADERPEE